MEDYEEFSEHNEQMTDEEQTVPVSGGGAEPAAVDAADAADAAAAPQGMSEVVMNLLKSIIANPVAALANANYHDA